MSGSGTFIKNIYNMKFLDLRGEDLELFAEWSKNNNTWPMTLDQSVEYWLAKHQEEQIIYNGTL